ncbi:MAG: DUF4232 domain-containing protein [Streptosporangiaceae bacterium]
MIPSAPAARRVIAAAALASGVALLAACGSKASPSSGGTTTKTFTTTASPPASGSAPSPSSSSAPAGPAACVTSALSASLGQGNGAAGSTIIPLEFRNTSSSACTLFGYPGVSFVTGPGGSQIGNSASEDSATPRQSVTLAAGSTAHALLQVAVAQNYPPSRCHLVQAHWLKIFPPGETAPLYVKFNSATCTAKSIRVLAVQTVQPGAANS